MGYSKRFALYISILILIVMVAGCGKSDETKEDSKEEQIKKSFAKTLDMYPIKNLEDLYDKEGYRDGEFKKGDKGTWVLYSAIVSQPKGESLKSRGMILKLDRNKRTAKGSYIIRELKEDKNHDVQKNEKKYPVKLVNNRIVLVKDVKDKKLKNEIESFELFSQYGNFNHFDRNEITNISYNPNAPNYSAEYKMKKNDRNIQQLKKRFNLKTSKTPKLLFKGSGDIKGSSVGYKEIEIIFSRSKEEAFIMLTVLSSFQVTK
ncbi:TPA: tandem-type lipoprotein [Staphylococcus aureus]|uniref:tandem-type lipoprotein n=1 Tax=Staphylococcus aureus TaxID=1280 RepID=UPI001680583B|nr:tandem-type lipoprotein [Staphylococcus aureus]MBD1460827.1 tandem-type lipoprotein [Staphylococcus aureus]MBV2904315.1 tandem-type lipoprotein [Staphylococcus aureus]MBV2915424.1 tandem-type lipoprotein [Staphylococcus aureus]MBV2918061.1 tandem-type lipoprotein [Staphylococcus aureus]MBV2920209.1 tandem-type lipoprotein [Staphylococcus aureus]